MVTIFLVIDIGTVLQDQDSPSESSRAVDDTRSLAERRIRRLNRRLPAQFRDILPQPPPPPVAEPVVSPAADSLFTPDTNSLLFRTLRFFRTLPNVFGLSRQYYNAVVMESSVAFIRGSSPIRRTIRKSKSDFIPRRLTDQFFMPISLSGCCWLRYGIWADAHVLAA
jgi:hypothetical protein